MKLKIQAVSIFSSSGMRTFNEDLVYENHEKGVFIIADGFGGPEAGVQASKQACESIRNFLEKEAGDLEATLPFVIKSYFTLAGNVVFNSMIFANQRMYKDNEKKKIHEKGGASVLAGLIDGDLLSLANVGTCSVTLFRSGKMLSLVNSRSYGKLLDPFITNIPESQSIPLMALGMTEHLEPEIVEYKIKMGDWILFYTDGIKNEILQKISVFQNNVNTATEKAQFVQNLLNEGVIQGKMPDNSSTVLVVF